MTSSNQVSDGLTAAENGLLFGTPCRRPADISLEVASGFDAIALWTADAAAPPALLVASASSSDGAVPGKSSGRDWKYLE
jgi:hypothetical protein